jgi:hypothetical protein
MVRGPGFGHLASLLITRNKRLRDPYSNLDGNDAGHFLFVHKIHFVNF